VHYIETEKMQKKIPDYYIGKIHGYEARKIIEDYELNYNLGTAVSYLLRANRKHETSIECIEKAIAHLEFELERLEILDKPSF
jgi:hypothetical protein